MDSYHESLKKTEVAREQLALLQANGEKIVHDEARLERQREIVAQCTEEEERLAGLVEERRSKADILEKQRLAAQAESVRLPPSNAPRPFDKIIKFWQNYAQETVPPNHQRPQKKARRIAETPEPSSSTPSSRCPSPSFTPSEPQSIASGIPNPSKRKRQSSPSWGLPPLPVYQIMQEYHSGAINYEPALERMRELWPNEADWKPLFDKLTQLEPDDDPGPVLGEIDDAIALYSSVPANVPSDPIVGSLSQNEFDRVQAQLSALSGKELLTMLRTKVIPKDIESILVASDTNPQRDTEWPHDNEETIQEDAQRLELERDLLSKMLGVSTGLDDGIFLVRCMVKRY